MTVKVHVLLEFRRLISPHTKDDKRTVQYLIPSTQGLRACLEVARATQIAANTLVCCNDTFKKVGRDDETRNDLFENEAKPTRLKFESQNVVNVCECVCMLLRFCYECFLT